MYYRVSRLCTYIKNILNKQFDRNWLSVTNFDDVAHKQAANARACISVLMATRIKLYSEVHLKEFLV